MTTIRFKPTCVIAVLVRQSYHVSLRLCGSGTETGLRYARFPGPLHVRLYTDITLYSYILTYMHLHILLETYMCMDHKCTAYVPRST